MTKIELPRDFAREISLALDFPAEKVTEYFEISEDKQGWFCAKKKPKVWLDKTQFKTLCAVCRDYGGRYINDKYTFEIPGPYVKKETSPPAAAAQNEPAGSKQETAPEKEPTRTVYKPGVFLQGLMEKTGELAETFGPSELEKAIHEHEVCYNILRTQLERDGYKIVSAGGVIDIVAEKKDEILAIEIKTFAKGSVRKQVFQAVGQLFYGRQFLPWLCKLMIAVPSEEVSLISDSLKHFLDGLRIELLPIGQKTAGALTEVKPGL